MVELVRSSRNPEELSPEFEPSAQASVIGWPRRIAMKAGAPMSYHGRAPRVVASAAGEPPAQDLVKSRGRGRSGDRIDPLQGFEVVMPNQAIRWLPLPHDGGLHGNSPSAGFGRRDVRPGIRDFGKRQSLIAPSQGCCYQQINGRKWFKSRAC